MLVKRILTFAFDDAIRPSSLNRVKIKEYCEPTFRVFEGILSTEVESSTSLSP